MSMLTIAIRDSSHQILVRLATHTGVSVEEALDRAVEEYRRKIFLDAVNSGYAELRADPEAWAAEIAERQEWDSTLMDGLDREEQWMPDGRCVTKESDHV